MASNSIITIQDTNRKYIVKLLGEGVQETAPTIKINPSTLYAALNANGYLLGANTDRKSNYRLTLKRVIYDIQSGDTRGYVKISFDGDNPNTLLTMSGFGDFSPNEGADAFVIPNPAPANTTGNVFLQTVGFSGNAAYSVVLDFRKEPQDFDMGRFNDPVAFNRGPAAGPNIQK